MAGPWSSLATPQPALSVATLRDRTDFAPGGVARSSCGTTTPRRSRLARREIRRGRGHAQYPDRLLAVVSDLQNAVPDLLGQHDSGVDRDFLERLVELQPAIGPAAFEVGPEVRDAFIAVLPGAAEAFVPGEGDRWLGDMYLLARQRLSAAGVGWIGGGGACTCTDASDWFSYRRDERTGRMASLIWLEPFNATEPLCPPCS